jgi:hypothetical protein
MNYQDALKSAITTAEVTGQSVVVKFWHKLNDFSDCLLESAVSVGAWEHSIIVACVDHKGNVTESDWIKAKLQEVAA